MRLLIRANCTVVLLAPALAVAATLRVPSQYLTINKALDAAVAGDSVLVAPGTYDQYETRQNIEGVWISSVAFAKAGIVLASEGGAAVTTLTMTSVPPFSNPMTIYGYPLAGPEFVIAGFTFTGNTLECLNCVYLSPSFPGEGYVRIEDCEIRDFGTGNDCDAGVLVAENLTIRRCRFHDINANYSAFGHAWGSLLMEDCEFVNCRSGAGWATDGGALTVRRTRFVGNVRTNGGGGAFYTINRSPVLFENCWFDSNQSSGPSAGAAALLVDAGSLTLRNDTFSRNYTTGIAGALWVDVPTQTATVEGNTFWRNAESLPFDPGGACIFVQRGDVWLTRNVIAGSTGDPAVGNYQGTIHSSCNVFWQNPAGNARGFSLDPSDVDANPMFCDTTASNFYVNSGSPCLPGHGYPTCTELTGAWGQGCGFVAVQPLTWGRIKSSFRSGSGETKR